MIGKKRLGRLTLHIDEETIENINADAERLDRSRGWVVRQIFKNYYEKGGKCCGKAKTE